MARQFRQSLLLHNDNPYYDRVIILYQESATIPNMRLCKVDRRHSSRLMIKLTRSDVVLHGRRNDLCHMGRWLLSDTFVRGSLIQSTHFHPPMYCFVERSTASSNTLVSSETFYSFSYLLQQWHASLSNFLALAFFAKSLE